MIASVLKYWLKYRLSDSRDLLNKAYNTASALLKAEPGDVGLYFACAFLNIEKGEFDKADEMIDNLIPYKNFYKNNEPENYAYILFLLVLFNVRCGRYRLASKNLRLLEEYSIGREGYLYDLLLGALELEHKEYKAAYEFLRNAYLRGCRSPYLYVCLGDHYENTVDVEPSDMFLTYLKWGIAHNAPMENIIAARHKVVTNYLIEFTYLSEKLFTLYPQNFVLESICNSLIVNNDYSEKAFWYYNEALTKQLFTERINNALMQAAFQNDKDDVNRYSLARFLESDIPVDIKPYIYHLILTDKKHKEFLDRFSYSIIQFAFYSLENNLRGRHYNSIYKYLIDVSDKMEIRKEYLSKAEIFLISDLFLYDAEVFDENVKYLWIQEKEKRATKTYELKNGKTRIKALSENVTYYCFGVQQKKLLTAKVKIKKLIESADLKLYQYFFNKKLLSTELLIVLSKYYMSLDRPTDEGIEVLSRTLQETEISYSFRTKLSASLGNCYYLSNDYAKAVEYYKEVDINRLNDYLLEQMLLIFVNGKEYEKAVNIIVKKSHCISDKTLFFAVKQLDDEKYYPLVANVAYELILKSWYDKLLLDIVLRYYTAGQKELQELSFTLSHMLIFEKEIDEVILSNTIWMHQLDESSQKIFVKLYDMDSQNKFAEDFVYYCIYEIMVNGVKLEFETLEVLENIFDQTGDHILAYALCKMYLEHGVTSLVSNSIVKQAVAFAEQDEVMFPMFKLIKDKGVITPYIEKYHPFVYMAQPNKEVYLYYKPDGEDEYRSKQMDYWRFGMYTTALLQFYGDKISYYFSEKIQTGSIESRTDVVYNTRINLYENTSDPYYTLNNALIYEHMFKYDIVESIITERLKEVNEIKGRII